MEANDPKLLRLMSRHIVRGTALEDEVALYASLPEAKRRVVLERLQAMDVFLGQSNGAIEDADRAAALLGMERRNFYRLLAKLKKFGPVKGLAPGYRNKQAAFPANVGLEDVVEEKALAFVRGDIDGSMKDAVAAAIGAAKASGAKVPSPATVQRRIAMLRRQGLAARPEGLVGRNIVVDQVLLDMAVTYDSGSGAPLATFILDRESLIVLGAGLANPNHSGTSLRLALTDMVRHRFHELTAWTTLPFAEQIERIDWVIDEGMEENVPAVRGRCAAFMPPIDLKAHEPGKLARRRGALVTKLIGAGIGNIEFLEKRKEAVDVGPDVAVVAPRFADKILSNQVADWNQSAIDKLRAQPDNEDRAGPGSGELIQSRLSQVFASVLDERDDGTPRIAV